jgi:hypothetical protein
VSERPASYTYAVLRLVPRVERGECFNVGVVLLCRPRRFLGVRTALDLAKLEVMAPGVDPGTVRAQLAAVERVVAGEASAGPMAALDLSERFHWLVSPSSTILQPGAVHPGVTSDPQATLERLFRELVLPVDGAPAE